MTAAKSRQHAAAREEISRALASFLRKLHVRAAYFAHATAAPPPLAYVTSFPRLSLVLSGRQFMEIASGSGTNRICLKRGDAIFVGRNCWNKPDWSAPVTVLTLLFGKTQIGASLVAHDGRRAEPPAALKTTISPFEGLAQHVLGALMMLSVEVRPAPLDRMLIESMLHACARLLTSPAPQHIRKAARTFEALCLYVQENFQKPMTRASAARTFGLTPNHVSRLFRGQGGMGFNDYVTLVRMERAKFMLREYNSPLKEIASGCGYADLAYFCRVFRKLTGQTPTEYRHES